MWIAAAIVLTLVIGWLADLRKRPYGRCWSCWGSGRVAGSTKRRFGLCGRCGGTGRRIRVGAKLVRPELKGK